MALDRNTVPQVMYKPKDPISDPRAELYNIHGTVLDGATDPMKSWVLKEVHGWWDEDQKKFLLAVTTLLPTDPRHAVTVDEIYKQIHNQIMVRVRDGFKYQMEWNPFTYPDWDRYEWSLDGTRKEYK
jgi:hypothetical protein